jgi:phosphoribosylamine--glycine ligase
MKLMLFISNSGESLPIVYRLKKEGVDCRVYIHNPLCRPSYKGILEKVTVSKLRAEVKKADTIVFDITRINERTKEDLAMLKVFGLKSSSPTVFGPVADVLKKDHKVIGASAFTEKIEMDRMEGERVAKKIGLDIPETVQFDSIKGGKKFLKGQRDRWVFKPFDNRDLDLTYVERFPGEIMSKMEGEWSHRLDDGKYEYMLQKFVEGIEISTEGWFDGKGWAHFNHTIEDKRLMDKNLGPSIGSQSNTVWVKKNRGLLVKELMKMSPMLTDAGYAGPIDINSIICEDGKTYFLEFTPRFGYDALFCLLTLIEGKLSDFFNNGFKADFKGGYASGERISIPPYPYAVKELLEDYAKGVAIKGMMSDYPFFWMEDVMMNGNGLSCAGVDGILGVVTARGRDIGESVGLVYRRIDKIKICGYRQYRTDLGRRVERAIKILRKWRVDID